MLTSDSFFSLPTQHDQSQETQTQQANKQKNEEESVPSVGLSYVKLCDTAALVH